MRKFAGVTQAGMESKLSFKVGGTMERLAVKVGQKVGKGQLLAQLDEKDFRLQLQQAQAGPAPILIRIETRAGHGAGTPTRKRIEQAADLWAFLIENLK